MKHKIEQAFGAFMDLGSEKAVETAVAGGLDEEKAKILVTGFRHGVEYRPYQMMQQVVRDRKRYAEAEDTQSEMIADGYPDDIAEAFAHGCLSSEPATPEQKAELDALKAKFEPSECQGICQQAAQSMQLLRNAKELLGQVRASLIISGASPEAADAFINGFLIK